MFYSTISAEILRNCWAKSSNNESFLMKFCCLGHKIGATGEAMDSVLAGIQNRWSVF